MAKNKENLKGNGNVSILNHMVSLVQPVTLFQIKEKQYNQERKLNLINGIQFAVWRKKYDIAYLIFE